MPTYGYGYTVGSAAADEFSLPYQTATFKLRLTNFEKRWNRDALYGVHSGSTPQTVFLTDGGTTGFPLEWFQDGTPANENALRFLMTKENGYVGIRFGRTPRDGSNREIHGPHLRQEVRSIMNLRLQHGNLIFPLGIILGNTDPYYYFVSDRLGDWTAKLLEGVTPLNLDVSYGEPHLALDNAFDYGTQPTHILSGGRVPYNTFFPTRVDENRQDCGILTGRDRGSTPSLNTGPSQLTNADPYVYFEGTSPSGNRLAATRMREAGRVMDLDMMRGVDRLLTMEVSIAGPGFQFPESGLKIHEYNDDTTPNINGTGASHTHHVRGWPYSNNYSMGDTVNGYGNNNSFTVHRDGGWRQVQFNIADDTTRIQVQPSYENDATLAPVALTDLSIRTIRLQGNIE